MFTLMCWSGPGLYLCRSMEQSIAKAYDPSVVESSWYEQWLAAGHFASAPSAKTPYSILMPPPNVTGILHFGHVLNHTIQDIYIRWNRLRGKESCWFPGLDHAGIATQTKVEQELRKEGRTRYDLGREAFVERTWQWKDTYGGIILEQLRRLGNSSDWDRTLFTMDESASAAVREVFIRLFDEGLIYRGKRIINWSPLAQSALSDEEVVFKEVKEHIYTLRYHMEDGSGTLLLSTVRPETIFADVAVAVNPSDERYVHLIGKHVLVPIAGHSIPIIADDYADPSFGTGCVKITPAHDPNDFEVGLRHQLPMPSCINADATLNDVAGEFSGMDRFAARKAVRKRLEELDLIEKVEDYVHNVGFSERGGEVVEPYLSDQWFVDMKPLAADALRVVQDGDVRFHPEHWVKTYEHWMTNVRDWCISRQLWWGHRIPVYYDTEGRYTAARSPEEAAAKLGLSSGEGLVQDADVLDTWFSSWLWPLTTLGWAGEPMDALPAKVKELKDFYLPTNLLVTGPDIIFFWVARMIMATRKFGGCVPFTDVYFTSIIRDSKGRKLSKSLGNSPDPLDVMTKYGADAVRFTMTYLSPLGMDVRLDVDEKTQDVPSMELGRNFANKIWNAGRFLQMKAAELGVPLQGPNTRALTATERSTADTWMLSRCYSTLQDAAAALDQFRITEYAKILYDAVWRDYCDWYVEVVKIRLQDSADAGYQQRLLEFAFGIYEHFLTILHPVMPFITEELWHAITNAGPTESIGLRSFQESTDAFVAADIEERFALVQGVVESVRRQRNEMMIPPSERLPLHINVPADLQDFFAEQRSVIAGFCRASDVVIGIGLPKPTGSVGDVVRGVELYLLVEGRIDFDKERQRLSKEIARLHTQIQGIEKKLSNDGFLRGASEEIVAMERKKHADWTLTRDKLQRNLESLS